MFEESVVVVHTLETQSMVRRDDMQYLRDVMSHRNASPWE